MSTELIYRSQEILATRYRVGHRVRTRGLFNFYADNKDGSLCQTRTWLVWVLTSEYIKVFGGEKTSENYPICDLHHTFWDFNLWDAQSHIAHVMNKYKANGRQVFKCGLWKVERVVVWLYSQPRTDRTTAEELFSRS